MSATSSQRRPQTVVATRLTVILVTVALVLALGAALLGAQARSQRQLADRFQGRGELAASFAATWVEQLMDQERRVAIGSLSGTRELDERFASAVEVFDFPVAGLLDSKGRLIAVHPRFSGLIGQDMSARYRHIATALQGSPAVSSVVVSASRGERVVAFAVPFETPGGRRVFSGTYELNRTPLGAFLTAAVAIPEADVYVVDVTGAVVATSAVRNDGVWPRSLPDALAQARGRTTGGNYADSSGRGHFFTSEAVEGTPWSLVMTAPHDTLFAPIRGPEQSLPWIVLGFVALLAGVANWMFLRLLSGRDSLRALNAALDRSARTDQLTGLPNRRQLDESLAAALSAGGRHNLPVSVLVIDLDHFKQVNDTYGHSTGDRVLEQIAGVLDGTVRTEDMVGRWGGEEFLAVLPHTDAPGATRIAERLRQVVRDTPYVHEVGGQRIVTTLSIGCATSLSGGNKDGLIHRADKALYRAKDAGRNSVRSAPSQTDVEVPEPPLALVATRDSGRSS